MTSQREDLKSEPAGEPLSALEINDLRRARALRRVLGDPRVRVQVPTEPEVDKPPAAPASKRYQSG